MSPGPAWCHHWAVRLQLVISTQSRSFTFPPCSLVLAKAPQRVKCRPLSAALQATTPSQTPWQTNPNHFKAWTSVSSCSEQKEHLQAESQNNYGATLGSPHAILFCHAHFSMPEKSCFIYCPVLWLFSVDSKSGITYWVMAGRSLWKYFTSMLM